MNIFHDGIKKIWSNVVWFITFPHCKVHHPFTDKYMNLGRWTELFECVVNRPSVINDEAIKRLPKVPVNKEMDEIPTLKEIKIAICLFPLGTPQGSNSIM